MEKQIGSGTRPGRGAQPGHPEFYGEGDHRERRGRHRPARLGITDGEVRPSPSPQSSASVRPSTSPATAACGSRSPALRWRPRTSYADRRIRSQYGEARGGQAPRPTTTSSPSTSPRHPGLAKRSAASPGRLPVPGRLGMIASSSTRTSSAPRPAMVGIHRAPRPRTGRRRLPRRGQEVKGRCCPGDDRRAGAEATGVRDRGTAHRRALTPGRGRRESAPGGRCGLAVTELTQLVDEEIPESLVSQEMSSSAAERHHATAATGHQPGRLPAGDRPGPGRFPYRAEGERRRRRQG